MWILSPTVYCQLISTPITLQKKKNVCKKLHKPNAYFGTKLHKKSVFESSKTFNTGEVRWYWFSAVWRKSKSLARDLAEQKCPGRQLMSALKPPKSSRQRQRENFMRAPVTGFGWYLPSGAPFFANGSNSGALVGKLIGKQARSESQFCWAESS